MHLPINKKMSRQFDRRVPKFDKRSTPNQPAELESLEQRNLFSLVLGNIPLDLPTIGLPQIGRAHV